MKIAIIGVGGRTGTMFAFELRNSAEILGIGREIEVRLIKEGKLYVERGGKLEKFSGEIINEKEFNREFGTDFIFLCIKNPVGPAVKYYYQKFKGSEKIPSLILSQNGISAADDAKKELAEIFGEASKEIRIIRVSLFNPISKEKINDKIKISYFLPIRLAFGVASGPRETEDIKEFFQKAEIEAQEILPENIKNMEYSKFFLNLIGMASEAKGLTIEEGLKDEEIFEEEIKALREYIRVVKKMGGRFLNLEHYPIKLFTTLLNFLPLSILKIFRKTIAQTITKARGGKEKGNIDEIEYYNGAVMKLGEKLKIETPINKEIYKKIKTQL
jgi:2-dehydropantoate 2-reductase